MSILKQALESFDTVEDDQENDNKVIVMQGPLSDIIFRALNIVYAKEKNPTTNLSLESQAQEVVVTQKLIENLIDDENDKVPDFNVWDIGTLTFGAETLKIRISSFQTFNFRARNFKVLTLEVGELGE